MKHSPVEREKTTKKDSLLSQKDSDTTYTRMWEGLGTKNIVNRDGDLNVDITCLVSIKLRF